MKKLTALLTALLMVLSLCACGHKNESPAVAAPSASPETEAAEETAPVSAPETQDNGAVPDTAFAIDVSCPQPFAGGGLDMLDFSVSLNSVPCEVIESGTPSLSAEKYGSSVPSALMQPFFFAGESYTVSVSFRSAEDFAPSDASIDIPEGFSLLDFSKAGDLCRIDMELSVPESSLEITLASPCAGDDILSSRAEASLNGVPCRISDVIWTECRTGETDRSSRFDLFCRGYDYTAKFSIVPNGGVISCLTSDLISLFNDYRDKPIFGIEPSANFGKVSGVRISSTEAGYYFIVSVQFSLDESTPVSAHSHQSVADDMDSTCVAAGWHRTYCRVCGEELSFEALPLAEHTWETALINGKECRVCSVCGTVEEIS